MSNDLNSKEYTRLQTALLNLLSFINTKTNSKNHIPNEKLNNAELCPCCAIYTTDFHYHHILPKVLGGIDQESNIIKICSVCHSKIHSPHLLKTSESIKIGIQKAREKGVKIGRPISLTKNEIMEILNFVFIKGLSTRKTAEIVGNAKSTVSRVIDGQFNKALTEEEIKWYEDEHIKYKDRHEHKLSPGRPLKLNSDTKEIIKNYDRQGLSRGEISRKLRISRTSVSKVLKELESINIDK